MTRTGSYMRILLLSSAYNSLTQRVHAELADRGHAVPVELALGDDAMRRALRRHDPDLVIAPMLTAAIPEDVWSDRPCFIVHPGPRGDRGPSSLDWAITEGASQWGVTVLQANAEMDAGDIWASAEFALPPGCSKSSLYRTEVADAALEAVLAAVARFDSGSYRPEPLDYSRPGVTGRLRPPCRRADRSIDWTTEPTSSVAAKLRAADSSPGVLDVIAGAEYYLFGGYEDDQLRGEPGAIIARRNGAICRATTDGAVWIPQLRPRPAPGLRTCKLPATLALRGSLGGVPEVPAPLVPEPGRRTYQEISYRQDGDVGYLEFSFPGGAMSTDQCRRLLAAYRQAQASPVRVIVLGGARDFFSNGIHLNVIETAEDPAVESWFNIHAIDDLVEAILTTTGKLTVAALAGNAAAGGLMLALAADQVWSRAGAVLNPHYRLMGLHGSEYWTYTLPRRVGAEHAGRLTTDCLPVTPASALSCGMIDKIIAGGLAEYHAQVAALASQLAQSPDYPARLAVKAREIASPQQQQLLASHRTAELAIMRHNFLDPLEPYARLRSAFVYKDKPTQTPAHLVCAPAMAGAGYQRTA
jgi:putative two-component system protein, hydrogenase maturation factor HypX/HoxX